MPKPRTPEFYAKFKKIYNNTKKYPTLADVANALSLSTRSIRDIAAKLEISRQQPERVPVTWDIESQAGKEIAHLKKEISALKDKVRNTEDATVASYKIKRLIHGINENLDEIEPPEWVVQPCKSSSGIACAVISDVHYGEVVRPEQVEDYNEFNRTICRKRLEHTFERIVALSYNLGTGITYDGLVLMLLGDLISGNIHEELAETNEVPVLVCVVELIEILAQGILFLLEHFPKLYIPCVAGNHGRLHRHIRAKNRQFESYEWIIYQMLKSRFAGDDRVRFDIPDAADVTFDIYKERYLGTHGDSFSGGGGIAGIFSPIMLGAHRKQRRQSTFGRPFDHMVLGHFHQYHHAEMIIINGALKGYDEYAYSRNFAPERPIQAYWICHPTKGITLRAPIFCDGYSEQLPSSGSRKVF